MSITQDRIQRYLRQLAPHQRDREAAQLLDESFKQLEAAKQRELELLAVIERIKTFSKEESNGTGTLYSWQLDDLLNIEPSQALREHEAKVLEEAADWFEDREIPAAPEALRRMAEERRKK